MRVVFGNLEILGRTSLVLAEHAYAALAAARFVRACWELHAALNWQVREASSCKNYAAPI